MISRTLRTCAVMAALALTLTKAAKESKQQETDELKILEKQIADMEAKLKAIEHIKLYAESVNLNELHSKDVEQTVAQFVKSTRLPLAQENLSPERRAALSNMKDKSKQLDTMMGAAAPESKGPSKQATILNQVIGKSLTKLDVSDYVYTLVPTRSLRQSMQTTISNAVVIAPNPVKDQTDFFQVLD